MYEEVNERTVVAKDQGDLMMTRSNGDGKDPADKSRGGRRYMAIGSAWAFR